MAVQRKYTLEDFETFIELPENEDRIFEFIDGEIVEKVPSNPYASEVAFEVGFQIKLYLTNNNMEGHITGEAGGYVVDGYEVAPDIAYLSKDKHRNLNRKTYNPVPPDLAVEVETNVTKKSKETLEKKIAAYLRAGTVVWVFYPDTEQVKVHAPDKEVVTLGIDDELDGGDVLPGFRVPVKKFFTH